MLTNFLMLWIFPSDFTRLSVFLHWWSILLSFYIASLNLVIFYFLHFSYCIFNLCCLLEIIFLRRMLSQQVSCAHVPATSVSCWILILQKCINHCSYCRKYIALQAAIVLHVTYFQYVVDLWWSKTCNRLSTTFHYW